jgi:CrcB protein
VRRYTSPVLRLLLVGVGGFVGSICRYLAGGWVQRWAPASSFPWGTLAVNLTGCLAIGLLAGLAEARQLFTTEARLLVFLGFLGGFTTFSSFGWETFELLRHGELLRALANVLAQVVLGLLLVAVGFVVGRGT